MSIRESVGPSVWETWSVAARMAIEQLEKNEVRLREELKYLETIIEGGREMSDQCKSCTAKGDAKKCESLECNLHETWIVERLKKEIKDLKTWEGLMKILDDAYPESIFTTELFDNDKRDAGVRIISLLRIVDRLERQINETHDARDLLLEDALKEVDRQRKIIETKENQDISDEARIAYINDPVFRHIVDRISEYMRSENFGASKFHEAINLAKEVNEHMLSRQI